MYMNKNIVRTKGSICEVRKQKSSKFKCLRNSKNRYIRDYNFLETENMSFVSSVFSYNSENANKKRACIP